jgi:predicted DCC family thiol-disulfide oxidoreductase YuxK
MTAPPRPVLIFDGVCNICSFGVGVVLKYDRDGVFDFAFAQGARGGALKRAHGMTEALDTVTVVDGDRVYIKSDAALYVASRLPFPWPLLRCLAIVPRAWRDGLYNIVARNRYKWFGQKSTCYAPPPDALARFLDKP